LSRPPTPRIRRTRARLDNDSVTSGVRSVTPGFAQGEGMKTIQQLYGEHDGKVSDKWSLYLVEYDRLFAPFRERPVRLLEIGIQNGGSLEHWGKYFRHAEKIVGCDLNPDCGRLQYDDPRIALVVADANTDEAQQQILKHSARFVRQVSAKQQAVRMQHISAPGINPRAYCAASSLGV